MSAKFIRFVGKHNSAMHTKYYSWASNGLHFIMVAINVQQGIVMYVQKRTIYDSGRFGSFF